MNKINWACANSKTEHDGENTFFSPLDGHIMCRTDTYGWANIQAATLYGARNNCDRLVSYESEWITLRSFPADHPRAEKLLQNYHTYTELRDGIYTAYLIGRAAPEEGCTDAWERGYIRCHFQSCNDVWEIQQAHPILRPSLTEEPRQIDKELVESLDFRELRRFEDDMDELPEMPVDCFPEPLRSHIAAFARQIQVEPEMVAFPVLCGVAAAVQGKYKLHIKPGWVEPLSLFTMVIAAPSERKSAAIKAAEDPLKRFVKEHNNSLRPEIEGYKDAKKILERQKGRLIDAAGKLDTDDPELTRQLAETRQKLSELKPVRELRLTVDDITPEALAHLLAENHGCMSVFSSEGGIFNKMAGLYNNGKANTDVFTKGFSGDTIVVDRRGTEQTDRIDSPALTICVMVQPTITDELRRNTHISGVGVLARFLYAMPKKREFRDYDAPAEPNNIRLQYEELIRCLIEEHDYPAPGNVPLIRFSSEAHKLSRQIADECDGLFRRKNAELQNLEEWGGKLHGTVCRIAALFHIALHSKDPTATEVSDDTLGNAWRLAKTFLIQHAAAALSGCSLDPRAVQDAQYIWTRLKEKLKDEQKKSEIGRRELQQACSRPRFRETGTFDRGLAELIQRGYLMPVVDDGGGRAGRPPKRLIINPLLHGELDSYSFCV